MYKTKKYSRKTVRLNLKVEASAAVLEAIELQQDAEYELQWRRLVVDLREACGWDY